jgi:uncharacterized protein YgfB (UPF0149 family)
MAFAIGNVINDMLGAAGAVLGSEWPKVRSCVKSALEDEKEALADIAKARIDGDIDDAEMKSQLADEKETLKAALLVCQVHGKLAAQQAVNAAIDVFWNAVKAAIKL